MNIRLVESRWDAVECDAMVLPLFEDEDHAQGLPAELDARLGGLYSELRETEEWKGERDQVTVFYRPAGVPAARLILVGAGKRSEYDTHSIRLLIQKAVRRVKGYHLKRVAIYKRSLIEAPMAARAGVEGAVLAAYEGDDYKTLEKSKDFIEEVIFVTSEAVDRSAIEAELTRGRIVAEATNFTRQLVNQPGNAINPPILAEQARTMAEKFGLDVEILGEQELREEGMGGVLAVAKGSDEPARFIVLKHRRGPEDENPIVFVGKGVTFDSGGLSIKPSEAMEDMKCDKAGGCAVLGAMRAIGELGLERNVIGLVPVVENMVSGRAQRPGDVIRALNGKTIEVLNTDAEGRLILADALTYAQRYHPQLVVDLATLTGACVVALGHFRAGIFSNSEEACRRVSEAAERCGERLWRLPLDDDYRTLLKSPIADIKNIGGRWGGAVTAAKFLEEFVGGLPWCHLDIAGVDQYPPDFSIKGATGFGVRTLVEIASGGFLAEHG